jgi:hypothetical protein
MGGHAPAISEILFNNVNLLGTCPPPTAIAIDDRKNLYFRSGSMLGIVPDLNRHPQLGKTALAERLQQTTLLVF